MKKLIADLNQIRIDAGSSYRFSYNAKIKAVVFSHIKTGPVAQYKFKTDAGAASWLRAQMRNVL